MATIHFPFVDEPHQFPFLFNEEVYFPFTIDNLLYYCRISPKGITFYLHNEPMAVSSLAMEIMILRAQNTLYLINGDINDAGIPTTELTKKAFITFKQYGRGLHTIGLLDPLTLGDIDPFSFANMSGLSANWTALENCLLKAVGKVLVGLDPAAMRIASNSTLTPEKQVMLGNMNSTICSIGLGAHRYAKLGEIDPFAFSGLDHKYTTFRIFGNLPARLNVSQEQVS